MFKRKRKETPPEFMPNPDQTFQFLEVDDNEVGFMESIMRKQESDRLKAQKQREALELKEALNANKRYNRLGLLACLVGLCLFALIPNLRLKDVLVKGNRIIDSQLIEEYLALPELSPAYLISNSIIEQQILELPLVDSVKVSKIDNDLIIEVQEKELIGYMMDSDGAYFIERDGFKLPIEQDKMSGIVYLPLLDNFSDEQLYLLGENLAKVDIKIIENLAEIYIPTGESEQLIRLITNNGVKILSDIDSLYLLYGLPAVLERFTNYDNCLYLDGRNEVIIASDCAGIINKDSNEIVDEEVEVDNENTDEIAPETNTETNTENNENGNG